MDASDHVAVYLCHCGTNISDAVDVDALAKFAHTLPGVAVVRECKFLCTESGQHLIAEDLASEDIGRVVVAACSPFMHEKTFRQAIQAGGLNPFNLQVANIREQVSWVTADRQRATEKSQAMLDAAVRRVHHHKPLDVRRVPVAQTVLVVGGGVTGIEATLRIANAGKRVILVEREPSIGGHVAMLDRIFPTLDCSACVLVPSMASVAEHPNVTLLSYSQVEGVRGFIGDFQVTVRRKARFVDEALCTGCGLCVEKCPATNVPSEFDQGRGTRPAIYFLHPQAVPYVPVIDAAQCGHWEPAATRICQDVCPVRAIDFNQQDVVAEYEVGAIVLATGYSLFDASRATEYGYGRWDDVVTGLQFERLCHPTGPTGGRLLRKDGRPPESVAILHCVGSRDHRYNRHCSRTCCMASLKFALSAKRLTGARVFSFFIDMRATGAQAEEFYELAQRSGVVFIHGRAAEVVPKDGKLLVRAQDVQLGRPVEVPVDMVVLSTAQEPRGDAADVAQLFGIGCSHQGFFMERNLKFAPVESAADGIFVAGGCTGPKAIPECVAQGSAAAAGAIGLLDHGAVDVLPTAALVDSLRCSGCQMCIGDCPYQAIRITASDDRTVARVNEVLCKSCGSCAATCPAGAITQFGFTNEQIFAEIEGLVGRR